MLKPAELDPEPPTAGGPHADTVRIVERAIVLLLLGLLLFGVFRVLQPFATAILFGAFIAIGTWPLRDALIRAGLSRGLAAVLMLLLFIVVVALPVLAMAPGLAGRISHGVAVARDLLATAPERPPGWIPRLPMIGDDAERLWLRITSAQGDLRLRTLIEQYSSAIGSTAVALGRAAAESIVQMLLALVVTTAFWVNGDRMAQSLRGIASRLGGPTALTSLDTAAGALRGVAWGVVGTGIFQGALLGLGLGIAGVPGAATFGFLGFVCSVSQVLGPLVVACWAGAAWWLYSTGDIGWAIFMLLWGAILVSGSDNIIRPLLISRGSAMPLTLIILGVFGGMLSFGFLGLFIGPALLAVAHALVREWRGQREEEAAQAAERPAA